MANVPKVPTMQTGLGARNAATTFDALNNALQFYMKLKDKETEDKRYQQEFGLKQQGMERQNRATDSQAKYYDALASDRVDDNARQNADALQKRVLTRFDNYPGARLTPDDPSVADAQKAGVAGMALSPERTLPATRLPGSDQEPQQMTAAPQQDTGYFKVNETEPSKMRAQQAAIEARAKLAGDAEAGRNNRALMSQSMRREALHAQDWYKQASLDMRRQGLERELQMLDIAMTKEKNSIPVDEFNMGMKYMEAKYKDRGIAGVLAEINGGGMEMPKVPTLTPPGAGPSPRPTPAPHTAPAAGGLDPNRFSVVVH